MEFPKPIHPTIVAAVAAILLSGIVLFVKTWGYWSSNFHFLDSIYKTHPSLAVICASGIVVAVGLVPGAAFGIFMRRWLRQHRNYHRWRAGRCPVCNYDLRAHNPGEKCPECGGLVPIAFVPASL